MIKRKVPARGGGILQLELDGKYPKQFYCTITLFSFDGDSMSLQVETAEILSLTTEILKEIR